MDPDPDPRGPKTCGSGRSGSGSEHWLVELTQAEDLSPVVVGHDEDRVRQQLEHLTRPQVREHQTHRQLVLGQPN
jgi:hypothetical protein